MATPAPFCKWSWKSSPQAEIPKLCWDTWLNCFSNSPVVNLILWVWVCMWKQVAIWMFFLFLAITESPLSFCAHLSIWISSKINFCLNTHKSQRWQVSNSTSETTWVPVMTLLLSPEHLWKLHFPLCIRFFTPEGNSSSYATGMKLPIWGNSHMTYSVSLDEETLVTYNAIWSYRWWLPCPVPAWTEFSFLHVVGTKEF